ncbi:MAG: hypothetical protein KGJ75_10425 [Alphaproteobacteria bacterium]|nr:hypothetical protein [Alphaproteobacteria bacterium]
MRSFTLAAAVALLAASAASAQVPGGDFQDGPKNEKIHVASGFVCPDRIGGYVRDAVGQSDPGSGADFCSYYGFDGIYGTVTMTPLHDGYDPEQSMAPQFTEQEGIGAKKIGEGTFEFGPKGDALGIYTRTYETSRLATLHYRILFTGAAVKNWVLETTVEYADPRDDKMKEDFIDAVYGAALKQIGGK